jgi:hypothetical protein
VSVVCRQVGVCANGRSHVQRSHTECGGSEYDRETSNMKRLWPTIGLSNTEMERTHVYFITRLVNHTASKTYSCMNTYYRI